MIEKADNALYCANFDMPGARSRHAAHFRRLPQFRGRRRRISGLLSYSAPQQAVPLPALYDRACLPGLIGAFPGDLSEDASATAAIIDRLKQAMRKERVRAGQIAYDLNRHLRLFQALGAEQARLRLEMKKAQKKDHPGGMVP